MTKKRRKKKFSKTIIKFFINYSIKTFFIKILNKIIYLRIINNYLTNLLSSLRSRSLSTFSLPFHILSLAFAFASSLAFASSSFRAFSARFASFLPFSSFFFLFTFIIFILILCSFRSLFSLIISFSLEFFQLFLESSFILFRFSFIKFLGNSFT